MMIHFLKWSFQDEFIETALGAILRTPGLILCDYWHQKCLDYSVPKSLELTELSESSLHLSVLLLGLLILLLPYEKLVNLYMHITVGVLLIVIEIVSRVYLEEELAIEESQNQHELVSSPAYYKRQILQISSIIAISSGNAWCIGFKNPVMKWFPNIYLLPILVRMLDYPIDLLPLVAKGASLTSLAFVILYLVHITPSIFRFAQASLITWKILASVYGNFQTLIYVMTKLFDPVQFVLYWIALFASYLWFQYVKFQEKNLELSDIGEWYVILLLILSEICDSPLTLIASCLAVMALSNGVIRMTNAYLNSCKSHAPPSTAVLSGITEGMVMFLLSMQTGLIDMKLPQRLGAMSIILFIVAASLFQTILEITHPVLLALSAASRNIWSHIKVLILCGVLCVIPAYMSYLLISTVDLDLWTMVVISSSLLTSIQVVGHLIHYMLYLYDSFRSSDPLDSLDDWVFYLKSAVHALELISALFVVCAGIKEAATGHWSFLNSIVLVVHCYFNVWVRIKNGWRAFLLRQAAVDRILTLVDATEKELQSHNDVCAICYSDMQTSAKVTPCGHYFHGGCLKKWLFVQDHCPMCSAKIIEEVAQTTSAAADVQQAEQAEVAEAAEAEPAAAEAAQPQPAAAQPSQAAQANEVQDETEVVEEGLPRPVTPGE